VVDDGGPIARQFRLVRLGYVRRQDLHPFWQVGPTTSADRSDPLSSRREGASDGESQRTRPQHHMQSRRLVYPVLLFLDGPQRPTMMMDLTR